ncbi:AAA family ATPase [Actinomadura sp. ATCC 31491]|uniref:AAA family ATPase n=1 Tax=Actinomadura luzonensis TaxID=2805427 RepID=A0ABT0G723_9ACTN|nr:AAA family ATPase [Actinomadura luzonensis]MCK2220400.1 AAA family ATPase [Actinomadura luzonensis]
MSARAARPARRRVVVVFIDLVGSTELAERLDPELLRTILDRYHRACTAGIAEHGGVVEKYIGDAIMAAFGIPISSEDDALRAVRAAYAAFGRVGRLSDELAPTHGIRLEVHCGIAAGEAMVIDTPGTDLRVIGDIVNTAARLQSAAGAGDILIGDEVARMVRAQARMEPMPPLRLKGKRDPVRAWRLLSPDAPDEAREDDQAPLIGRDDEVRQLHQAYQRTARDHRACVFTLLGLPGVGKSRLVRDFTGGLPAETSVLVGRCPSYGAGVTYRPITEMLESLNGDWPRLAPALEPSSARALRGLATAGPDTDADIDIDAAGVEEIARAVRGLFEALARRRPLVVIWEDLHWAEPTLLELVEDLAAWLLDVPVLLVCVARPELLDLRPTWGGGMACAYALELGPLDPVQMRTLVACLAQSAVAAGAPDPAGDAEVVAHGADPLLERVAEGADGNPLFAELMLETLLEEGADAPVPPTVQALIAARLDRLGDGERDVLERAATIGQGFTRDRLATLLPDDPPDLDELLWKLLRQRVIRRAEQPGSYRFTQTLTRDTVYAMTRKELRAAWHLTLADRLAQRARTPPDGSFEEPSQSVVAHHLEMACLLKRDVQPDDPLLPALTARAARALIGEGTHALHRKDLPAALALLERGRELLPPGDPGHRRLAVRICDAGLARGDGERALAAVAAAERMLPDDPRTRLTCAIQRETLHARFGTAVPALDPLREPLAADPADDLSWCRFHELEALTRLGEGRFGGAEAALRAGLARARSMGDRYEESRLLIGVCELSQWSSTPIAEGLALCAELLARFADDRALLVPVMITQARLLALAGEPSDARAVLDTAARHAADLHLDLAATAVTQVRGLVESLDGRPADAVPLFRRAAGALRAAGQPGPAATLDVYAARELLRQGRHADAARTLDRVDAARTLGRTDAARAPGGGGVRLQARGELLLLALRAHLAALDGDHGRALTLAAEAGDRLAHTDDPCLRGDVLAELADAYRAADHPAQAADAAGRARRSYAAKGATWPRGRATPTAREEPDR